VEVPQEVCDVIIFPLVNAHQGNGIGLLGIKPCLEVSRREMTALAQSSAVASLKFMKFSIITKFSIFPRGE